MESVGYATHLARHDDGVSDVVMFMQADPLHHQVPYLLDVALKMISTGLFLSSGVRFLHLNQRRFLGGSHPCVHELLHNMGFTDQKPYASYCCNQFIVTREAISSAKPIDAGSTRKLLTEAGIKHQIAEDQTMVSSYEAARMLLNQELPIRCSQDTSHDARPGIHTSALYEHMWHVLFKVSEINSREF